jgi:hypothetical protein
VIFSETRFVSASYVRGSGILYHGVDNVGDMIVGKIYGFWNTTPRSGTRDVSDIRTSDRGGSRNILNKADEALTRMAGIVGA